MIINFDEFPNYDKHPHQGKHIYSDSKEFDLELEKEGGIYTVKAVVSVEYTRWFHPETYWNPSDDECEINVFSIEPSEGIKVIDEIESKLTPEELLQITTEIYKEIEFE